MSFFSLTSSNTYRIIFSLTCIWIHRYGGYIIVGGYLITPHFWGSMPVYQIFQTCQCLNELRVRSNVLGTLAKLIHSNTCKTHIIKELEHRTMVVYYGDMCIWLLKMTYKLPGIQYTI